MGLLFLFFSKAVLGSGIVLLNHVSENYASEYIYISRARAPILPSACLSFDDHLGPVSWGLPSTLSVQVVEKWVALVRFRKAVNEHIDEVTRLRGLLRDAQARMYCVIVEFARLRLRGWDFVVLHRHCWAYARRTISGTFAEYVGVCGG